MDQHIDSKPSSTPRQDEATVETRNRLAMIARAANYGAAHPSDTEPLAVLKAIKRDFESIGGTGNQTQRGAP